MTEDFEQQQKIQELLQKVSESKERQLDLSADEDLSLAIMNLIAIEEHFFFTGAKTGKSEYYDLLNKQQADKRKDVAIVRLEQIYPLPIKQIDAIVAKYKNAELVWVQEEPCNMGAWPFIMRKFTHPLTVISRKEASSPATGYGKQHASQQQYIINTSFELVAEKEEVKSKKTKVTA